MLPTRFSRFITGCETFRVGTMALRPDEWSRLFIVETSVLELIVRGTVLYFAILALIRIAPRRTGGELAMMDLALVMLIADAAGRAFGEFDALGDSCILMVVLMGWNYVLNVLTYHFPAIERFVSSSPLEIVRHGRMLRANMKRELLTAEELAEELRRQGIEDIGDVKSARIEADGHISIIKRR